MKTIAGFLIFLCLYSVTVAQTEASADSTDLLNEHQNIFLSFLFPKGIAQGVALRSYLRSSDWSEYRSSHSDREAFDEIFEDADELCHDDRSAAILASSIAVLEHKTIPVKLFFGMVLQIPLTIESQKDFDSRTEKLPVYLYDPKIPDRDKLQHFFFSAYFQRTLKMNWLVRLLGNAVEIGEELFIIGGSNDERDRHANNDGIRFGESCELDSLPMPSRFLTKNP
ncbi:MAG: hypothetical protein ACHQM6_07385 [Candidatus Kapaibacterium sp.]